MSPQIQTCVGHGLVFDHHNVQSELNPKSAQGILRLLGLWLMLGLWLGMVAAATSPYLHHALHADASNSKHTCVVTLLAKSDFLSRPILLTALVPVFHPFYLPSLAERPIFQSPDFDIFQSRAPPAMPSPSAAVAG